MSLSSKKLLILDRGPYSYLAPFLARYFGKVYYHRISGGPYLESPLCHIGEGLPGVTWTDKPWRIMGKVDAVFFPDVYDGDLQVFLRSQGIPVCGSLGGERMELDKYYFLSMLKKAGLPVAKTYRAEGLTDLWNYVKDKDGPLYMKNADPERGDWETLPHFNEHQTRKFIENKRAALGERAEDIEILVQSKIDAVCEFGIDTFRLNGKIPKKVCGGYEDKDEAIVEAVFNEVPKPAADVEAKIAPVYERLGYAGPYSNELRITAKGKVFPIDETCRCASPPTASCCSMLGEAYAQAIDDLAHDKLPEVEEDSRYAAEMVLSSKWHNENEIHIGSVEEVEKLGMFVKNGVCRDGQIYAVPNGDDGIFGSIVSTHKTSFEDAIEDVTEKVKGLKIYQLDFDLGAFDRIKEKIEVGRNHGIDF